MAERRQKKTDCCRLGCLNHAGKGGEEEYPQHYAYDDNANEECGIFICHVFHAARCK